MDHLNTYEEDEARGRLEDALPAGGTIADKSGTWLTEDVLNAYRDAVAARVRQEVAAFIRANIDMQGRDFPDAESVANWLEETR